MATQQIRHPIFARFYARLSAGMEQAGVGEQRDKLLAGLSGAVVEVGAGSGLNFGHYPETVRSVLAVEPESYLRTTAERAARAAPSARAPPAPGPRSLRRSRARGAECW